MKHVSKFLAVLLCTLSILVLEICCKKTQPAIAQTMADRGNTLRIATFNIRSFHGSDTQDWDSRKKSLDSLFRSYDFDIIGVQEPYQPQMDELAELHGGVYDYFVVTTGNFNSKGWSHSNPVYYRRDRFKLLNKGVFWFSEQPDSMGSVSWEASQARNCVWVQLEDRRTGVAFYLFNSHFDHKSTLARNNSAALLVEKIKSIAGKDPVICTGDFNTNLGTNAYKTLASSDLLTDTYTLAKKVENDNYQTSHGYKIIPPEPNARRIDHIFISRKYKPKEVKYWKVCNETFDGHFASDHFPVYIDLTLGKN